MNFRRIDLAFRRIGRFAKHEQVVLTTLAAILGTMAGGAAILFREAISLFQLGFLGFGGNRVHSLAADLQWWHLVLAPAVGGLLVGIILRVALPRRRVHNVAHVIEAATLRGGRIDPKIGIASALASAISIGCGASVGREGPVVHLGATIGSYVSEKLKLGRSLTRTLLGCGVAGAVAASFNAPMAGVFFALEVVIGHYGLRTFGPIVIASVAATIVSRIHFGDFPAFIIQPYEVRSFWEFPAFAFLGLVGALTAIVFMRSIGFCERWSRRTPVPRWIHPAVAGLLVGAIAVAFPQVLGVGYEATDEALNEQLGLWMLLALLAVKTAATAVSIGGGFGGGVFSPSLFIGAMLGGAFGILATGIFPELSSGHGAYTIVGMGAVAGAVLGAPISTILIVFELTGEYGITIAVMIAAVVSSTVTQQTFGHSYFTWQLARRGFDLRAGREQSLLRAIRVRDVMKQDFVAVDPAAAMSEIRERLQASQYGELFVVDRDGVLHGTITLPDLSESAFDTSFDTLLNAEDVARLHPPVLEPGETLQAALQLMDSVHEEHLAVVADHDSMRVVGFVHQRDVLHAYSQAMMQARKEERGED